MVSFNASDLRQLRMRLKNKLGSDPLEEARERYTQDLGESMSIDIVDNIREGKKSLNDSVQILIEKLNKVNELIEICDVDTKEFTKLLFTQSRLMELIFKYSGNEDVAAVKRAHALALLKGGNAAGASAAITGQATKEEVATPQLMDGDYDEDDEEIL